MGTLTRTITFNPAAGYSYVNVSGTPATGPNTIASAFPTLASGMQIEWDSSSGISISSAGTVTRSGTGSITFSYRVWQGAGSGWSATQSFDFVGLSLTGQAMSLSFGEVVVDQGGTVTVLAGQSVGVAQGTLAYVFDQYLPLSGHEVAASQGAMTVGVGEAVTVALVGQAVISAQGYMGLAFQTSVNVPLLGQSITSAPGTLGYYSETVAVALVGQVMTLASPTTLFAHGTEVVYTWTPEGGTVNTWTPESAADLTWTPESGSTTTWVKEG